MIFHKTNEISTTRAKWPATIVSDFDEFSNFMSLVEKDIDRIGAGLDVSLNSLQINDTKFEALRNVFEGLREETKYLRTLKVLCTYPVILNLYMCVFIFSFPSGYF